MRKILLTSISFVALAALVACGGSSNNIRTPIPAGPSGGNTAGFSNSSLKGNYVFSAHGVTISNNFATAGVFTADGAGNISSGTRDTVNDFGSQVLSEPITGTYSVNQDGRGQAVLNGSSGQVIYRFTMESPSTAKLFQISNTSDAVGRILLQSSTPAPLSGTYIIRLDGEDTFLNIFKAVGALTTGGAGTLSGLIDQNDNGTFSPQLSASGPFSIAANGRGTMSFATSAGTHNFVVYTVTPGRVELVSTDRNFFLHGFGDLQTSIASTTATFAGNQVFNISGFTNNGNIIETGRLALDGAGNLTNGVEDLNEAGLFTDSIPFGGNYAVASNGRWTASLTFTTSSLNFVGWQVSPQQSTLLTTNTNILETGTMRAQTVGLATASVIGNYAEDLSGFLIASGNVESGGNFDADGAGNLNGTIDSQTPVSINTDIGQTGNYSIDPTSGRTSGTIGAVPVRIYAVDANTIYLISTDPNRLYQGQLVKQQ